MHQYQYDWLPEDSLSWSGGLLQYTSTSPWNEANDTILLEEDLQYWTSPIKDIVWEEANSCERSQLSHCLSESRIKSPHLYFPYKHANDQQNARPYQLARSHLEAQIRPLDKTLKLNPPSLFGYAAVKSDWETILKYKWPISK